MLSHFIMALICLASLQSNDVFAGKTSKATKTDSYLHISTPSFLTTLPTSAPATPQEKNLMRRVNTDENITSISALEELVRATKIAQMKTYIQQLKEEKIFAEKKLEEKKRAEWLEYVRASNNSGYFPHSNYLSHANYTEYKNNSEKEFPGSHMCW